MIRRRIKRALQSALRRVDLELRRVSRADEFEMPPDLELKHLANCALLPNRRELLRVLPRGGVVAELGVAYGDFSEEIIRYNSPRELHLVDVWAAPRYRNGRGAVMEKFKREIDAGNVVIHEGLSVEVVDRFPDETFDWMYIDTVHTFKDTFEELVACSSKLRKDGYVAGHDFSTSSPNRFSRYGVIPACATFCEVFGWRFEFITMEPTGSFSFCLSRLR